MLTNPRYDISWATASGTVRCFGCAEIITDRTLIISFSKRTDVNEICLHQSCASNLIKNLQIALPRD